MEGFTKAQFEELRQSLVGLSEQVSKLLGYTEQIRLTGREHYSRGWEKGDKGLLMEVESQELTPTGLFGFMVERYTIGTFGALALQTYTIGDVEYAYTAFRIHVGYRHHGGGSNGHELCYPWSGKPVYLYYVFNREAEHSIERNRFSGRWHWEDPFALRD